MSRVFAAVVGSAALLTAAPAFAGPCEQLAGGRWLFHLEGGAPAQVITGVMDFRDGAGSNPQVRRGRVFFTQTSGPLPAYMNNMLNDGLALPYGSSASGRWVQCTAQPGNIARLSRAINMDLAVSADGRTAVATRSSGMTGWATREPASPALPAGPVAQQRPLQPPRN